MFSREAYSISVEDQSLTLSLPSVIEYGEISTLLSSAAIVHVYASPIIRDKMILNEAQFLSPTSFFKIQYGISIWQNHRLLISRP